MPTTSDPARSAAALEQLSEIISRSDADPSNPLFIVWSPEDEQAFRIRLGDSGLIWSARTLPNGKGFRTHVATDRCLRIIVGDGRQGTAFNAWRDLVGLYGWRIKEIAMPPGIDSVTVWMDRPSFGVEVNVLQNLTVAEEKLGDSMKLWVNANIIGSGMDQFDERSRRQDVIDRISALIYLGFDPASHPCRLLRSDSALTSSALEAVEPHRHLLKSQKW